MFDEKAAWFWLAVFDRYVAVYNSAHEAAQAADSAVNTCSFVDVACDDDAERDAGK